MRYSWIIFFSLIICIANADPSLPKPCYLLEMSSLGIPASGCEHAALRINDLILFDGKLYVGYGDAVINTGPTAITYYDFKAGELVTEFTVDEEAIYSYKVIDGTLMIPGIDATEDWNFGNIYTHSLAGWKKHRTIPHGIHVNDLAFYNNILYASTGTYGNIGDSVEHYFGAIFSSTDDGVSWDLVYTTPSDDRSAFRITALCVFNEVLYTFPFAYTDMTAEEIPKEFHNGLNEKPYSKDKHLIILDDILGICDVITFNGDRWQCQDIIRLNDVCYVTKPFIFNGKLVLPVLAGEYVDYLQEKKHLVPHVKQALFTYDGSRTKEVKLDFDRVLDVVTKADNAYLLIQRDNLYYIARTSDLKNWQYFVLPPSINDPRAFEYDDNTFFIGTKTGNLFVSQAIEPVKRFAEIEHCVPENLYAEAELVRDGHYYWIAITDWQTLGKNGKIYSEVKYGNIIKVTTNNISRFSIFLPNYYLDPMHETTLIINDMVVYEDMTREITELKCSWTEPDRGITWEVTPGDQVGVDYVPMKKVLGTTQIPLLLEGVYPLVCTWKASVLSWATKSEGAIIPQTSVRQGADHDTIYLEDIYDMHYRDRLCTFKVTGEEIVDIMIHNLKQPLHRRCCLGDIQIKYDASEDPPRIEYCSHKRNKTYEIVTTEFLAQRSEQYLGRRIEYELLDCDVYDAIIQWFDHFHTIEDIEPTMIGVPSSSEKE